MIPYSQLTKGSPKLTSEMLGDGIRSILGDADWLYSSGLYPKLKNNNSSDAAKLSIIPLIFDSEDNVSELKSSFFLNRTFNVEYISSDTFALYIKGDAAVVFKKLTSKDVIFSVTLGDHTKEYQLTIPSKYSKAQNYKPLKLNEVSADGWIKAQIERDWNIGSASVLWNNSFLPTSLGGIKTNSNVNNKFKDDQNRWVYQWNYGEMEGNLSDAAVRAMFLTNNNTVKSRFQTIMNFMVDSIAATQYGDSVAHIMNNGAEIWGQTCMARALLAYYEYTGNVKYLNGVKTLLDKTIIHWNHKFDIGLSYFGRDFAKKGQMNHSLTYVDILEYLYNKTQDPKYVDFAFRFYNDFTNFVDRVGESDDGGADASLDNLMDSNRPFYGHAPHTVEQLRMPIWLSTFTKDSVGLIKSQYEQALLNIPVKLNQSLSPTKGLITDTNKHESVNGKFSSGNLPYEYCSLTETLHTLSFLFHKYCDSESAETAELLFFNSAQGARFPDGKANIYLIADNVKKASETRNWRDQFSARHGIRCCNINELLPKIWT